MTIALFSTVPPPPHYQSQLYKQKNSWPTYYPSLSNKTLTHTLCSPSSSSTTPTSVISPSPDELAGPADQSVSESGCKACGREEIENGCNGEGRIQGGIATVPGFGWWPIKAYRPCPGFVASGGRYRRQGQSMDEVVSGGSSSGKKPSPPPPPTNDSKPIKKEESTKKVKG